MRLAGTLLQLAAELGEADRLNLVRALLDEVDTAIGFETRPRGFVVYRDAQLDVHKCSAFFSFSGVNLTDSRLLGALYFIALLYIFLGARVRAHKSVRVCTLVRSLAHARGYAPVRTLARVGTRQRACDATDGPAVRLLVAAPDDGASSARSDRVCLDAPTPPSRRPHPPPAPVASHAALSRPAPTARRTCACRHLPRD